MRGIFRKPSFTFVRRKKQEGSNADTVREPSALEGELPIEVKSNIASFLPPHDLLKLSETSKRMKKDLDVVVVSSALTDRASQNKTFDTNYAFRCFAAVVFPRNNPQEQQSHCLHHSTTFSFDLVANPLTDGMIWIEEHDDPFPVGTSHQVPDALKNLPVRSGKTVASIMAIDSRTVHLSFVPKIGKIYQFGVVTYESNLQLCKMTLHHVGLAGIKPPSHTAFQFAVRPPRTHRVAVR